MMAAATFVHCNTAAALEAAAQKHPGWPLVVTGHSMGGKDKNVLCHQALYRPGVNPCFPALTVAMARYHPCPLHSS